MAGGSRRPGVQMPRRAPFLFTTRARLCGHASHAALSLKLQVSSNLPRPITTAACKLHSLTSFSKFSSPPPVVVTAACSMALLVAVG